MNILGISAFYHDAAAAIVVDGEIIAAAQEERFTRKKHDPSFPKNAIKYCLEEAGIAINQLDAVVFYDKPLLKFERLLETYYGFAPKGVLSFITSIPVWLKEKMFLKKLIKDELKEIDDFDPRQIQLLFPEHHLSHSASAFYPSPFEEAAILTIDGVGEWATASISHGKGNQIQVLKELKFPHSLGLLYSAFTYFLGFKVNSGEYKLMGLAPYGNASGPNVQMYVDIIKSQLIDLKEDGSIWLNQKYFSYATGLKMVSDRKWERLFGFPRRDGESNLEQHHCDLALAIQWVTEEIVIKMAKEAKKITGSDYLCLAGGVALNCVANGKLEKEGIFKQIYIQPAAGDAGGALGAALAAYHIKFEKDRRIDSSKMDAMKGAYLGPSANGREIEKMAKKYNAVFTQYEDVSELDELVAKELSKGAVIGWFQGRMEFGPRALGARSILGDPRNPETQLKLNLKIKYRENFRPFAPSVLAEDCSKYFDSEGCSPYMLLVHPIAPKRRKELPSNYHSLPIMDKLYTERSDIQSITHVDFTGRVQTVHQETNPRYYNLISAFKKETGYGLVVNTSFNVRGEPIVCTPEEAYECFMRTEMDYLVIENYIFAKDQQQELKDSVNWKKAFSLD